MHLEVLAQGAHRFDANVLPYCLMFGFELAKSVIRVRAVDAAGRRLVARAFS
jgi:hypothetical protein